MKKTLVFFVFFFILFFPGGKIEDSNKNNLFLVRAEIPIQTEEEYDQDEEEEEEEEEVVIRIAITADGHWGANYYDTPERSDVNKLDYQERHRKMIKWLNNEAKENHLDFVVFNGDLVHNKGELWAEVKNEYDKLKVPYYVVHGNHDGDEDGKLGFREWKKLWGTSYNFVVEEKGVGFIFLGTGSEYREFPYEEVMWDYKFLEKESKKFIKKEQPVFVITHISFDHPRYGGDYKGSYGEAKKYHDYVRKQELIKAVVFSHNHNNKDVRIYDGQVYLYSGHFGHWPSEKTSPMGYRIIEYKVGDDDLTSYWVNGKTKEKKYFLK